MILIRKNKDPGGCWGNMFPCPVTWNGKEFRSTEALFQSMRFEDETIIEAIREQKSPMAAKMIAKKHADKMTVEPMSNQDLDNMRICLRLKLEQHPELKEQLKMSRGAIIEDCSKRQHGSGLFWGAAEQVDGNWKGQNWLGRLWMELRAQL